MINSTYSRAYTEVLEIIKYFPEEEYAKIPEEKIEFYKNNMDKDYVFLINPEIDLSEQNISSEANVKILSSAEVNIVAKNQIIIGTEDAYLDITQGSATLAASQVLIN